MDTKDKSFHNRYEWVDVLRFLGIFAIYLGHFGNKAGKLYSFVFSYHVPLFFFIAGFFALKDIDKSIGQYVIKKIKQLLIPYAFFALISIITYGLLWNSSGREILNMINTYAYGIRNTLVSGSLWFIPCIFVVSVAYFILNKILRNKYFVLATVMVIFIIDCSFLPKQPSWFMNIDSAMYYILFYALGNITFNKINKVLLKKASLKENIIFVIMANMSILITVITYLKGSSFVINMMHNMFKIKHSNIITTYLGVVIVALSIILINILMAYVFRNIKIFQDIGANTLVLCGIESVIKTYLECITSILGLQLIISNPLSSVIYTFFCLVVAQYTLSAFLKKYFSKSMRI